MCIRDRFFNIGWAILELVKLRATLLTLMFGANSAANETVNPSIAALVDAIIEWFVKPLCAATVENKTIDPLFCLRYLEILWLILPQNKN